MVRESTRERAAGLAEAFAAFPCINDHSHVVSEPERLARDLDALAYFGHPYQSADLQSAGMSPADNAFVADAAGPLEERWARFAPYWAQIRLTGFSQCVLEGWRAVFGIDDLTADTVGPLSAAIRAARRPGHYAEVLRDRANIAVSLVQMEDLVEVDRELFLRWIALHETTHAVQFAGVDWLRPYLGEIATELFEQAAVDVKPGELVGKLLRAGPRELIRTASAAAVSTGLSTTSSSDDPAMSNVRLRK
jgi:hypothetical protein